MTTPHSSNAAIGIAPQWHSGADGEHFERVALGHLYANRVTFDSAVDFMIERAHNRLGGYVVTPNVDHVCLAEEHPELVAAYDDAALSLVDGKPLMWLAASCGTALPVKISGSDLVIPLLERAGEKGMSVFIIAADQNLCERSVAHMLQQCPGLRIAGYDWPTWEPNGSSDELLATFAKVRESEADLLLLGMGSPKQEYAMHRFSDEYYPALAIGVGATFSFLVGDKARAPKWISEAGLEWAFRLVTEPRRLWHRYLVRDRAIGRIWWRSWQASRTKRRLSMAGQSGSAPVAATH